MIYAYDTLKEEYKDKKIYIWNINRDSVILFMMLAFRRIDICGFVTLQEPHAAERYMNRPVVALSRIKQEKDAILLVSDTVSENVFPMLTGVRALYWKDARGINEELRKSRLIVYGTGDGSDCLAAALAKENLEIELYCVTKREKETHAGKKVIEVSELRQYEDCAVLISVKQPRYRWEILESLSDYQGQVYLAMENIFGVAPAGLLDVQNIMLVQCVDLAIRKHRRIYLYGKKNLVSELIQSVLHMYGVEVSGYVNEASDKQENIQSIFDVAYEGVDDKLVIINEEFPEHLIDARENVEFAGFSLEKENYTALAGYKFSGDQMLSKLKEYPDPLVGGSILYQQGMPGWKVYGRNEKERVRIMILGGSTSSEVYHPENWVSKLYYKLSENGIRTIIYNGAHTGNDIAAEILRFLRDGYILKPQIVVSMSGVNNVFYKCAENQFNEERLLRLIAEQAPQGKYCSGVYNEESLYDFWSRNIKLLKRMVEFYGAKFFSFLQPMNILMEDMSIREKSVFEGERTIIGKSGFACYVNDKDGYVNLMRLFEHQEGMYMDACHYTDKANQIIANKVYEVIMPDIQRFF